jgi:hypothetical protein
MSAEAETASEPTVDLRQTHASAGTLVAKVLLQEPQPRVRVLLPPGKAERAEARFDERNWAAKHYWQAEPGVVVYEWDQSLPAGPIMLHIPFRAG